MAAAAAAGSGAAVMGRPTTSQSAPASTAARGVAARATLLSVARLVYYLGVPGWLLARLLGA